jgi:hypothetical protein
MDQSLLFLSVTERHLSNTLIMVSGEKKQSSVGPIECSERNQIV